MSWFVSPWIFLVWDSLGFLDLGGCFLHQGSFLLSPHAFSCSFILSSSSGMPMIWMLGQLIILSQRSLMLVSFLFMLFFFHFSFHYFFLFSFFPVSSIYFHLLSSSSLSFLLPQLLYCWFPPKAFNLSYCIVHYWLIILYFFYVLFKNSFILSICVSSLFTVRNTQRASQSYTDKGRQKKEWGNQEQKRESQKGSEWSSW